MITCTVQRDITVQASVNFYICSKPYEAIIHCFIPAALNKNPKVLLHKAIFYCDLQYNTDERIARQVVDYMLQHACNLSCTAVKCRN